MEREQFTYNQVEQQGNDATVLLPRSSGEISTGHFRGQYDPDGRAVILVDQQDGTPGVKLAAPEGLSDQVQERLAERLGGTALRSEIESAAEMLLRGTDEQYAHYQAKVNSREEAKRQQARNAKLANQQRAAADHRYNLARQSGASHEEAERSANRGYSR